MSKHTNDWLPENTLASAEVPAIEKRSRSGSSGALLVQRYLQNPFSLPWSKLTALLEAAQALSQPQVPADYQSEQRKPDSLQEPDLYPHFTDRVDPSLYYTIFFP